MGQEEKSGEVCEGDRNEDGIKVEPKGATQLHPMSNRERETGLVEVYTGSIGRPNLQGMPEPGNWPTCGPSLYSRGMVRKKVELVEAGRR